MKKILFIGSLVNDKILNGFDIANQNIEYTVDTVFKNEQIDKIFIAQNFSFIQKFFSYIFLLPSGINLVRYCRIVRQIKINRYDYIILNSSIYGGLLKHIDKKKDKPVVVTFFHNIEKEFSKEFIKNNKDEALRRALGYLSVSYNELVAVNKSDFNIVFNDRDANMLTKIYNKKTDIILPLSLKDLFNEAELIQTGLIQDSMILVGNGIGSPPNIDGMRWFVTNVMPEIKYKLKIIGKGMERYKEEFKDYPNVEVIGTVPNLSRYYYEAALVIIPVFYGSGMKTKTAEALMFGKTIIGTTEAFQGYKIESNIGVECNTKDDFVNAINSVMPKALQLNIYARNAYLQNHSITTYVELINKALF